VQLGIVKGVPEPRIAQVTLGVIESPRQAGRTITMGSMTAEEIAADIAGKIYRRELASGQKLPTTKEYAAEYGVHTNTIVMAMRELRRRGQIRTVRGGGRYVA
jgi:DNA-binding GntR family transcriptional regulator